MRTSNSRFSATRWHRVATIAKRPRPVDVAVEHILTVAHEQVSLLLTASRDRLSNLAEALLLDETLEVDALKAILDAPQSVATAGLMQW